MSLKEVVGKAMEYIPFVGIIPGVTRIYIALNPDKERDNKISKLAVDYLGIDSQSPDYSVAGEIFRGGVSCIPIVNFVLIPIDITRGIIKAIFPCKKTLTPKENLEKVKESLTTLHGWYQASAEVKAKGGELTDFYNMPGKKISGVQKRTESHEVLRKEILGAFGNTLLHMKIYYNFPEQPALIPVEEIDKSGQFDSHTFYRCLERMLRTSEKKLMRHAFYMIDVSADCNSTLATTYVRTHYQAMMAEIESKLQQAN